MEKPVKRTVALALTLALLLAGVVAALAYREAQRQRSSAARAGHACAVLTTLDGLTIDLGEAEGRRCSYLLHPDAGTAELCQSAAAACRAKLQQLHDLVTDDAAQQPRLEEANRLVGRKLAILEQSLRLRSCSRFNDRNQATLTHELQELGEALRPLLADLRSAGTLDLDHQAEETRSSVQLAGTVMGVGNLASLLFLGVASVVVVRKLATGAESLSVAQEAERLARERARELTALREQLETQLRQVQQLACVGRVTSEVAHDFNNLLTLIIACSEASIRSLPADAPSRHFMAEVMQAGQRAATLTRQLLSTGRPGTLGRMNLNLFLTDLEPLLRRLVSRGEVVLTLGADLAPVWADRGRLDQVVLNLVVNARDAMPAGGKLTLETRLARPEEVASHADKARHGYGVLIVTDTGCGMDCTTRARLFEPFFTTKGESGGTGLGMAIVDDVVHQCGGWVDVESEIGQGTTIRIYLPLAEPANSNC